MSLVSVTKEDQLASLVSNAYHREQEVQGYQVNIDNYALMLAALPQGAWPAELIEYKKVPTAALPAEMDDADVSLISDYQYRDKLLGLLRTERLEQSKAQRVLDALCAQIPADQYSALVLAHKAAL